jgi:hypothetical protein
VIAQRHPIARRLLLLRASTLVALLAAIMLVIAGAPSRALANPCDPCPPDCPMMKQMAASAGEQHKAPDTSGKAHNPCKQGLACQVSATMTAPAQSVATVRLTSAAVDHQLGDPLAAPSRPPDRSLRPPIQL